MVTVLLVYSVLIIIASVLGGMLTQKIRVTHLGMQLIMSLVGGLILGVAILHMLPHAVSAAPQHLNAIVFSMLLGVLGMLLLMRLFHAHQHTSDDHGLEPGEDCSQAEHHHSHGDDHPPQGSLRWLGLSLGMTAHSLLDGLAIASYVAADQHGQRRTARCCTGAEWLHVAAGAGAGPSRMRGTAGGGRWGRRGARC